MIKKYFQDKIDQISMILKSPSEIQLLKRLIKNEKNDLKQKIMKDLNDRTDRKSKK